MKIELSQEQRAALVIAAGMAYTLHGDRPLPDHLTSAVRKLVGAEDEDGVFWGDGAPTAGSNGPEAASVPDGHDTYETEISLRVPVSLTIERPTGSAVTFGTVRVAVGDDTLFADLDTFHVGLPRRPR